MSNEEQMLAEFNYVLPIRTDWPDGSIIQHYTEDEHAAAWDGWQAATASKQREIDALNQQVLELSAQVKMMREALNGVIEWDKQRQFIVPYKVRDPIHAAIKIEQSDALLSHDNEVAAKALEEMAKRITYQHYRSMLMQAAERWRNRK